MKNTAKLILLIVALVILISFLSFRISGFYFDNANSSLEYTYSWTKAICNENQCQDYVIYCKDNEFVRQTPITGAVISIPEGWEDPRNETMRERVCD